MPDDWQLRPLGAVLEKVSEPVAVDPNVEYRQIGIRSHGKGIFYKEPVTGATIGSKRVFWVKPDAFIVNIVFAWEQAVARTTDRDLGLVASHRFPMYRPRHGLCDVDYLVHFFKTKKGKALLEMASPGGAGRNKTLGQKEFLDISIPFPPLAEQRKIASILSAWDTSIEVDERLLENSNSQKKALMQLLTTGRKRLNGFKDAWKEVALGELGTTYSGLSGKSKEDFGQGASYIPYKNIFSNSRIDVNNFELVNVTNKEQQNLCKYGDIFFTTSSETPEEVGMSSVLLDDVDKLYLNSFCFGFRLTDFKTLHPQYARYVLRAGEVRKSLNELAQGSTRFNISKKGLLKIKLTIPPIDEQLAISTIIEKSESQFNLIKERVFCSKKEKDALVQQLFSGNLRVKTDQASTESAVV